jgi:AraC-like DNA-binding protein
MFQLFFGIQFSIKSYFQYFPVAPLQKALGIHLAAIGHTKIMPGTDYPPGAHPVGRAFSWERGRVLHALQIIAIREGEGSVEWMREQKNVKPGCVFIIRPGEWHRYRPLRNIGWVEDWIELRGYLPEYWLTQALFNSRFVQLEHASRFFEGFDALHGMIHSREYVPEGVLESKACALVCEIASLTQDGGQALIRTGEREMIARARKILSDGIDVMSAAKELGVSYLSLYRSFKRCTGCSPKQYAESARLAKAEALLSGDQLNIKEISAQLGYNSASHFSLAFKRCYGLAPADWRANLNPKRSDGAEGL